MVFLVKLANNLSYSIRLSLTVEFKTKSSLDRIFSPSFFSLNMRPTQIHHLSNRVKRKDSASCTSCNTPPLQSSASVSGLRVELLTDVVDDFGNKLVQVVKLVHEEGVLLVGVGGDVLQLILGRPRNADGVRNDAWIKTRKKRFLTSGLKHVGIRSRDQFTK